jgi:hypothetical protein
MFRTKTTGASPPKPTVGRGRGPTITTTPLPPTAIGRDEDDTGVCYDDFVNDDCCDDPNDPYAKARRLAPEGTIWTENDARPGDRLRETLRRSSRS